VGAEVALPGQPLIEQGALVSGTTAAPDGGELAGQAVLQERAYLVAEGPVIGAFPEVHAGTLSDRI
jgi:hypothetical protein